MRRIIAAHRNRSEVLRAGIALAAMHRFDFLHHCVAQHNLRAAEIGLELRHRGCTNQVAGKKALAIHKRERHLCRIESVLVCDVDIRCGCFLGNLAVVAREQGKRVTRASAGRAPFKNFPDSTPNASGE